ncbi:MAG: hypothetical protein ACLQDL_14540 [Spirochaetia bacterium]
MKTRAYLGLWAIEEPREDGPMPLATFVNQCQNMRIAHQMFKGTPRKVKWFFGSLDGPPFKPRFAITVPCAAGSCSGGDGSVRQGEDHGAPAAGRS